MRSVALDTSFLISFLKNPDAYKESPVHAYDEMLLPAIVVGEYRAGLFRTREGERSQRILAQFLTNPKVRAVPVTERTADLYAKVYQALRAQGRPIPQNDMWIAAAALEHGADLATQDAHFQLVPMLTVVLLGKS